MNTLRNPLLPEFFTGCDAEAMTMLAQTYDRIAHMDKEPKLYSRSEYREAAFRLRGTARAKLQWGDDGW